MSTTPLDTDQIGALIVERVTVFDEAQTWVAVVLAESAGDPVAYNLVDHDPTAPAYLSQDSGLFQVNSYWHPELAVHEANRPPLAWEYAWSIATNAGEHASDWRPWVAYMNGSYLNHMDNAGGAIAYLLPQESDTMDLYEPAPSWNEPAAGRCRVGMVQLEAYLVAEFGGDRLGCYSDRSKTGGSRPSLHRDGRAIDVGWVNNLAERERAFAWLVDHAEPLGLQMVLNYVSGDYGGVRWRLPYTVNETGYTPIAAWGSPGHWLHIERTNAGADDPRTIEEIIAPAPTPPPPPEEDLAMLYRHEDFADWFMIGTGALHMSPALFEHYSGSGVEQFIGTDRNELSYVCNAAGFDFARLTPL